MDQTLETKGMRGTTEVSKDVQVLEALYDRLFQAVTYAPAGQTSLFDKQTTFIQFAKNAALNTNDYKNALSPVNPKGDLRTAELFARMVDTVPALDANYSPTSNKVSETYKEIVDGAISKATIDAEQQKIYDSAYAYLNKVVKITDFTGAETTSVQPTPIYNSYNTNKTAYIAAVSAYRTAYLGYNLDNIDEQRKWQANEPLLKNAIDQAYQNWRSQGAAQVEQALAAMASSINNIAQNVIESSQKHMEDNHMASSMGIPTDWYMTYPTPTNWYDDSALPNFAQLTLKSDNLTTTGETNYTDYSSGASANWGLWSVGGEVSGHHADQTSHMDASTFELNAKIAVVQINRPWMNDLIFRMKGWSLKDQPAGSVSNGELKGNSHGMLPLIPTAFIVARDITIKADWSTEDKKHVEDSISTKANVGWGPFSVNGSYSHGSSSDYFNSTFDGGTLRIPGMQIIGWVNQIVPFSAPVADQTPTAN